MATREPQITIRSTLEWRDAVDAIAAKRNVSRSTLIGESVRLLAELLGESLPERFAGKADQNPSLQSSLDFDALGLTHRQN